MLKGMEGVGDIGARNLTPTFLPGQVSLLRLSSSIMPHISYLIKIFSA